LTIKAHEQTGETTLTDKTINSTYRRSHGSGRHFHRHAMAAGVAAVGSRWQIAAAAMVAPSEQIMLGVVGLGSRAFNLIHDFLNLPACRILAVCNIDRLHDRDSWQVSESDRA
jgi:hypothetical protein